MDTMGVKIKRIPFTHFVWITDSIFINAILFQGRMIKIYKYSFSFLSRTSYLTRVQVRNKNRHISCDYQKTPLVSNLCISSSGIYSSYLISKNQNIVNEHRVSGDPYSLDNRHNSSRTQRQLKLMSSCSISTTQFEYYKG